MRAEAGFEDWLSSVSPTEQTDVIAPGTATFDLEICVPSGTASGIHNFQMELVCEDKVIATQDIVAVAPQIVASILEEIGANSNSMRYIKTAP